MYVTPTTTSHRWMIRCSRMIMIAAVSCFFGRIPSPQSSSSSSLRRMMLQVQAFTTHPPTPQHHRQHHHHYRSSILQSPSTPTSFLVRRMTTSEADGTDTTPSSSTTTTTTTTTSPHLPKEEQKTALFWTTNQVRQSFIDYFQQQRDHTYVPSSSCVPLSDPTLLFTNAGMNQFKSIFLGQIEPNTIYESLNCVVNSQKCIRAGGKHNDLDDVGRDTYHHTFFEMLGTWSFNNVYFKEQAIHYAFDILTTVYQLDPNRLYATYFMGDDNVPMDVESRDFWSKYLPPDHVLPCTAKDNFWEMGDTGPCGPCTEIHYDRIGNGRNAAALVNQDDPNVIEIWNIVFIQYNRDVEAALSTLPAQHVDTGMGLERLVSIMQNRTSNYDIDCFQPLFQKIAEYSMVGPYTGRVEGDGLDDVTDADPAVVPDVTAASVSAYLKDTAYRAIADHARTLSFAIADGAVPNNEGRGYVLRRILRRATRYGQQVLGAPSGFFATLIPVVVETFGPTYPELITAQDRIIEIIKEEEQSFSTMLDRGIKYFTELKDTLAEQQQTVVLGEQAFFLYDSLGFPIDLTEQMAQEAQLTVDMNGFQNAMEEQKQRSRLAQRSARFSGTDAEYPSLEFIAEQTAYLTEQGVHATDDGFKYKVNVQLPATVMDIYTVNGFVSNTNDAHVNIGDYVGLVLDKTSFYSEAGGQETDTGRIELMDINDGSTVIGVMDVLDVQVYGGFILHKGVLVSGEWKTGMHVTCHVNYDRRQRIAPNHSMTHVLNAALRQVLGDGVEQRGSLCNEDKLRFDFSHKKAMSLDELKEVERICQTTVSKQEEVTSDLMSLSEAKEIDGVRAVFGEVYPDPVRVIRIGQDTSVEFCGGTHVTNTAEAEAFVIIEETAVAKGIRRITAVTKDLAKEAIERGKEFTLLIESLEKFDPSKESDLDKQAGSVRKDLDAASISACIKAELRGRIENIQKAASDAKAKELQQRVDTIVNDVKVVVQDAVAAQTPFVVAGVDIGSDAKTSQKIANAVKKVAPNLPFLGISEETPGSGGKVFVFAIVPDSYLATTPKETQLKADEWVVSALQQYNGRGGGKPNGAQAQAQSCDNIAEIYKAAKSFAELKLVNSKVDMGAQ